MDQLHIAGDELFPQSSNIREAFAPNKPEDKSMETLKLILDVVGIGFLVISHASWHNVSPGSL
jgi:hypothetical protein